MSILTLRDLSKGRFSDAISRASEAQSIVFDVDFDFFCQSEHLSNGNLNDKTIDRRMFDDFFKVQDATRFLPVVGHDESLQVWLDHGLKSATCIHFDYHHDCYISRDRLDGHSLSRLDEVINIANYLPLAKKCGLLSHVIWVAPLEIIDREADEYISIWIAEGFLSVISWAEYLQIHDVIGTKIAASGHTMALSPDFVSPADLGYFFDFFECDEEFRYRALDYGYFSVLANRSDLRWRWHAVNLSYCCNSFFHGSPVRCLTHLDSSRQYNFVSPSRRFACCFESNLIRDGALSLGIEPFNDDPDTIIVSGETVLLNEFKSEVGSTYEVFLEETPTEFPGGCSGFEFFINGAIENLSDRADRLANAIVHDPGFYLIYPHELMELSDRSDSRQYQNFIDWMGVDDSVARSLPSSIFYLNIFCELQGVDASQFFPLIRWYRFGSRELFGGLSAHRITTEANGYHGLQHCLDVGLLGVLLASLNNVPATPIFLAALAHDLTQGVPKDHHNAKNSAGLFMTLISGIWEAYSSKYDSEIAEAIACHSSMQPSPSATASILRDADRIRLSWERGFDPQFFETEWGMEFAKRDPSFAENVLTRLSFANGSVLEINLQTRTADLVVLNSKFGCSPDLLTDPGLRASFINHYKVTKILVFGVGPRDNLLSFESPFLSDGVLEVSEWRTATGYRPSSKASERGAVLSGNDLSHLITAFKTEELHIRVTSDTIDEVVENIDCINNNQISLVVPGNTVAVKDIIICLIAALKVLEAQSDGVTGAKIICEVAWCHFVLPEEALTYFKKIEGQYSAIVSLPTMSGLNDMVPSIVINEKERHDQCGECAFSLHCPKRDFELGAWKFGHPIYQSQFQGWNPYGI